MKYSLLLCSIMLLPGLALPQASDSSRNNAFQPAASAWAGGAMAEPHMIIRENVTFTTTNLQLTPIESQILDAEVREVRALLSRDTSSLRQIWRRDFMLDHPRNELITGQNPLPYYVLLNRFVQKCTPSGTMVFTSGFEVVQELKANGKVGDRIKRPYFHTWTNEFGVWKLATNRHD